MKQLISIFIGLLFSLSIIYAQNSTTSEQVVDYSQSESYEIGGITITGIQYLDKRVLRQISGLKEGETIQIPGDKITTAIKKYWDQGLFSDVQISIEKIEQNKAYLEIYLKELPRLAGYQVVGVKNSERKEIKEKLGLSRGEQVTQHVLNSTRNTILDYYKDKGYLNTEVNIKKRRDTLINNSLSLFIEVDKNRRVKVNEVKFKGNTVFPDWRLSMMMKKVTDQSWYHLFKSSKYTEDLLEKDKKKIVKKYQENGYWDAQIVEDSVYTYTDKSLFGKPKEKIILVLTIDEGNQYYFGDFKWVGNTKYSDKTLGNRLQIEKGSVFDPTLLQERLYQKDDAVSNLYLNNGYLFFNLTPVKHIRKDTIDFEVRIHEGDQAVIDEIMIEGNTKTYDHVIRREVRTKPGKLFKRYQVKRSVRELANLGFFDPQKLDVKPIPNRANGTVDIKYTVAEKSTDQLELSAGYGGGRIMGTIGLKFNNFSIQDVFNKNAWKPLPAGSGQKLSIQARTQGRPYQSYSFSFTEPWLGGTKPNSFSFSMHYTRFSDPGLFTTNRLFNYGNRRDIDYNRSYMKTKGITVGLGRQIQWPDDYFSLSHQLNLQQYELKDWSSWGLFGSGTSNHISLKTSFSRNSIDQPLYPKTGSQFNLGLQLTPPYSFFSNRNYDELTQSEKYKWVEYHKWTFKGDWYLNLVENLVMRFQTRFGYIGRYNEDIKLSPFEKFEFKKNGMYSYNYYGRDIITLRGYENNAIDVSNMFTKYTWELRYPVALKQKATVYGMFFAEAINGWNSFSQFQPFDVKRTAGFGVRAYLPMLGMLGVDFGYGFDIPEAQGGPRWIFRFTIGQGM